MLRQNHSLWAATGIGTVTLAGNVNVAVTVADNVAPLLMLVLMFVLLLLLLFLALLLLLPPHC